MIIDRDNHETGLDHPIHDIFDLTSTEYQTLLNATVDEARTAIARGDVHAVRGLAGHFALVAREGELIRMARSLAVPMRYFIVKRRDGPALVVAHRIADIRDWLENNGFLNQFHPSYTRMVPAHHITELRLIGCPDPQPQHHRFFTPAQNTLPADLDAIGRAYAEKTSEAIAHYLQSLPEDAPVGVLFSGGIDSGMVLVLTYHVMLQLGMNPGRLKAFTLSVATESGADCSDLAQARQFLAEMDLLFLLEPVQVSPEKVSWQKAVAVVEDYKPLDVQAGTMTLTLLEAVRERYPDWVYLMDGDGGDENLKDYPIEDGGELTIRSVLNNLMLYHEGWGVDAIKHSATFSGGLSRGCTRSFGPAVSLGFRVFSPLTVPDVVEVAEGIPFIQLTDWQLDRLYALKGEVVARGVQAVSGRAMPIFEKRRFQHGATDTTGQNSLLPASEAACRAAFRDVFEPR